jgi:hypothetical protein
MVGEIFWSLAEARVLIERWRKHDNQVRPHSALGYCPPVPESLATGCPSPQLTTHQPMAILSQVLV